MLPSQTDFSVRKILGIDRAREETSAVLDLVRNDRKRKRRTRTTFCAQSVSMLEVAFSYNCYPDVYERLKLATIIGEEEARVQVWFQNRRARAKRNRRAERLSPTSDNSDALSASTSSANASFSPVRRPVTRRMAKSESDGHASGYTSHPFHPGSVLPNTRTASMPYDVTGISYRPYDVTSATFGLYDFSSTTANTMSMPYDLTSVRPYDVSSMTSRLYDATSYQEGTRKSPLWSPGSPTFSKLFEFPPKAHTPSRSSTGPVHHHLPRDESLSSRPSSCDSWHSGSDDGSASSRTIRQPSRIRKNNSIEELQRSERRPADRKVFQPAIAHCDEEEEDTDSDGEGALVIDLSLPPAKRCLI